MTEAQPKRPWSTAIAGCCTSPRPGVQDEVIQIRLMVQRSFLSHDPASKEVIQYPVSRMLILIETHPFSKN